ncbi:hypothetical protein ACF0H5_024456 [Mactra antiquata]
MTSFPDDISNQPIIEEVTNETRSNTSRDFDYIYEYLLSLDLNSNIYLDLGTLNIVLIILYGLIFITGLFGNTFVIFVIVKFKSMRTLTNYFLVNLAIGDIFVLLICIPITLGRSVYKKWIFGEILCKLAPFVQGSVVAVSVLSLLSISVSRYFAIYKPLIAKMIFSARNVRFILVGIWVIAFSSFSPLLVVNSVESVHIGVIGTVMVDAKICEEDWGGQKYRNVFNIFVFCIMFAWPFIIMTIAYMVIWHTLWFADPELSAVSHGNRSKDNLILHQRRRTVKMLICVVTIFGLSWLPYYIVEFWLNYNMGNPEMIVAMTTVNIYVYPLVILLGLSNSAVNPICYCFMSYGFRRGLKQSLQCLSTIPLVFKRGSTFFRSSFKMRYSYNDSFDTANV